MRHVMRTGIHDSVACRETSDWTRRRARSGEAHVTEMTGAPAEMIEVHLLEREREDGEDQGVSVFSITTIF